MTWLWRIPVLAALVGAGFGAREVWRVHFDKPAPADPPAFEPREPLEVAPLADFGAPWAAVAFVFAGLPCLAVRLPSPIPGALVAPAGDAGTSGSAAANAVVVDASGDATRASLAAFSRVCTHQACLIDLNLDVEAIAFAFNHRGEGPKLTCACHYSVFDPMRAGRAVSGPARLPLPRVRLRLDDRNGTATVVADGIERSG